MFPNFYTLDTKIGIQAAKHIIIINLKYFISNILTYNKPYI